MIAAIFHFYSQLQQGQLFERNLNLLPFGVDPFQRDIVVEWLETLNYVTKGLSSNAGLASRRQENSFSTLE